MASHIKIKTEEDTRVHFDVHRNNYTLCGLETGGDESIGIMPGKYVKVKVNCPDCIGIVNFCHNIKTSEFN